MLGDILGASWDKKQKKTQWRFNLQQVLFLEL